MKSMTKNITSKKVFQYAILLILIIITMKMIFKNLDIKMLSSILKIVDKRFILLGLLSIFLYVYLEGLVIKILIDGTHKLNVKFMGIKLATMSFYYNLVTPFSAGSQPILIYTLTKYKMPLSKASAVVTNKTLIYQAIVTLYCTFFIFVNIGILKSEMPDLFMLASLGVGLNVFVLIMATLIVLNPYKIIGISKIIFSKLSNYKMFKFIKNKENRLEEFLLDYSKSVTDMFKNKKILIYSVIVTIIQLTFYFSTSFWIYKAFDLSGYKYVYLLTLQVFLYMAVSPMPTPGNIGANELAFFKIFATVFPKPLMGYAVLLYGGFVYYLLLIGSGIFTLVTHFKMKKETIIQSSHKL